MTRGYLFIPMTFLILWLAAAVPGAVAAPQSPELQEALTLDRDEFVAESIAAWQKYIETSPPKNMHIYAGVKMCIAYAKTGRFLEAMKAAQALADKYPNHYDVQFNLANMMSAVQRFDQAVAAFHKVVEMRPQEGLGHVGLGLALFGNGKTDEAVKRLRQARALFKEQKNISWYQNVRIMIGQMKSFAPYPPDFSNLWLTNNIRTIRDTYETGVFRQYEETLNL
ncbi:exported hypothetical protein [Nitrospina gracilis 3/211]|uniref:Uncharacterized protein n=2 Tax=Nitrospina TaxID=35800 RepID=M1Z2E3_NITG3|nr:tetratricopeptide repeat protein [Nitrospina sp. Nb-3]MCF8722486.1 tetratricopeptide (TPR) repeat protein [Nitrospina sp. Nb-3]CCQ91916.1 exported hypothetical protein [Nitrospina gracilis 3/211]